MSLFGGDATYEEPQSQEHEYPPPATFTDPADPTPPPSIASQARPDVQQVTYSTYDPDDSNDEDYIEEPSEDEVSVLPTSHRSRPNRFTGKASTWREYTAADRKIATSLDQIEAADLSAHLYNAHALKRRVRLPGEQLAGVRDWQGKDAWLKKGRELDFVDVVGEVQKELVPAKRWTAWPLNPRDGSTGRLGERGDWREKEDSQAQRAGDELREEVVAVFLKQAKERFMSREEEDYAADLQPAARSGHRSKSAALLESPVGSEQEDEDRATEEEHRKRSESENKFAHIIGSGKQNAASTLPRLKPVVLADDEYAQRILEPSVNSLLARIDRLSADIRRTRLNHFGRGAYNDTSGSEAISDVDSVRSSSRSVSRSRSRSVPARKPASRATSRAASAKIKKSAPKSAEAKLGTGNESESASDYGAGDKSRETSDDDTNSTTSKKRRPYPNFSRESSVASTNREASGNVGLMDWSEVLGIASMGGWDPRVIARATQRCAALFDESMAFHSLDEDVTNRPNWQTIQYTSSIIPAPDLLSSTNAAPDKRPFFEAGTLRCPHPDCRGYKEDFAIPYRVIEHVKRVHGYDPRTNDSDNEDRKVGGVHRDGFLQPVTAKQGWIGSGRAKSKASGPMRPKRNKRVKMEDEEGVVEGGDGDV